MIRRAFALAELLIATVIIGVAVVAILSLVSSQTVAVNSTSQISEAVHLANNIHEFAMSLPLIGLSSGDYTTTATDPKQFSNVSHLNNWNSGTAGPINCDADRISGLTGWKQYAQVKCFELATPSTLTASPSKTNLRQLTVTVTFQDKPVYACSWIMAPTVQ